MALAVQEPSWPWSYTGGHWGRRSTAAGSCAEASAGRQPVPVAVVGKVADPAVTGDPHSAGFCAVARAGLGVGGGGATLGPTAPVDDRRGLPCPPGHAPVAPPGAATSGKRSPRPARVPPGPRRRAAARPTARTAPAHAEVGVPVRGGRRVDARPARRQGRGRRRDDARRAAGAARLHDHHRGLQRLLRQRPAFPGRHVGAGAARAQGDGAQDRQAVRRSREPAAGQRALRRQVLHAGDDGHRPQPGPQRTRRCRASPR